MKFNILFIFLFLSAIGVLPVHAERFELENAIIDSVTSKTIGGGKESGELAGFFVAQKKVVYGVLNDIGISLGSLPVDIREKLEKFHTTNFEAFKMFSLGLNAQDEGKFAAAKAFFEKAVELDPNFELAGKLSFSMPNTNVIGTVQLQAALAAASQSATSSGKVQVEVELSGAIAALQSGQNVVVGSKPESSSSSTTTGNNNNYTSNEAGSGSKYADRKAVGVSYTTIANATTQVAIASTNEWSLDQEIEDSNGLIKVGDSTDFLANRDKASSSVTDKLDLGDGSTVTWGKWQSGTNGNFTVSAKDSPISNLGPQFQYMIGQATREMPTTGTASFIPAGGFLDNATGSIDVDFVNRNVALNNLGFGIDNLAFSGLNGASTYSDSIGSGFFKGNYTSGSCTGCTAFSPNASVFTGNFMGENANGLMFSTIMQTGTDTVAGVHTFSR